jgi:hypothetical protein
MRDAGRKVSTADTNPGLGIMLVGQMGLMVVICIPMRMVGR